MTLVRTSWKEVIDTSKPKWRLNNRYTLDFTFFRKLDAGSEDVPKIGAAFENYLRHALKHDNPNTTKMKFYILGKVLKLSVVRKALVDPDKNFLLETFGVLRKTYGMGAAQDRVKHCRAWYVFCADEGVEGFDPDAATAMANAVIGGSMKGVAVKRLDPDEGPLQEVEMRALERALWNAYDSRSLPIAQITAGLIFLLLGPNPENVFWLNEGDVRPGKNGKPATLMMPRIKKGHAVSRADFMPRNVSDDVYRLLVALQQANAAIDPPEDVNDLAERPLFLRKTFDAGGEKRKALCWFFRLVQALPSKLGVEAREGRPMKLFPRRLRYSFARRQALRGVSPDTLAIQLDHTSLATVLVYYDPRLDLIPRLDEALTSSLAPFAAIALGHKAPPPRDTMWRDAPDLSGAPLACLNCREFRPVSREGVSAAKVILTRACAQMTLAMPEQATLRQQSFLLRCEAAARNATTALAAIDQLDARHGK